MFLNIFPPPIVSFYESDNIIGIVKKIVCERVVRKY